MSADNTVAILRTKRTWKELSPGSWTRADRPYYVWRVAEVQAIENFEHYVKEQLYNVGAYIKETWGRSPVYLTHAEALQAASVMEKQISERGYLEYGIQNITTDYVFFGDL